MLSVQRPKFGFSISIEISCIFDNVCVWIHRHATAYIDFDEVIKRVDSDFNKWNRSTFTHWWAELAAEVIVSDPLNGCCGYMLCNYRHGSCREDYGLYISLCVTVGFSDFRILSVYRCDREFERKHVFVQRGRAGIRVRVCTFVRQWCRPRCLNYGDI